MTQKATLEAISLLPYMKARFIRDTQEYRVAYRYLARDVEEDKAYYTNDADDALATATVMSANHINGRKIWKD